MNVLYETKDLIVAVKEPGVLSEIDGNKRSMPLLLGEYRKARSEDPKIFTVHRLDRDVGGIMVFAKNERTASELCRAVAQHLPEKEYLAVVAGVPEKEGVWEDLLFRDAKKGKTYVVDRMRAGVREAKLSYERAETVVREGKTFSLLKIRLYTGRTHQIRVQCAYRGFPIFGDGRYGGKEGGKLPALFSCRLAFPGKFDVSVLPTGEPFSFFSSLQGEKTQG